jgi:hypothetical protein
MTPEEESQMKECVFRCLAGQTFQLELIHQLEIELEEVAHAACDQKPGVAPMRERIKRRTVAFVRERMRHYADVDPDMASWISRIADEYEKS